MRATHPSHARVFPPVRTAVSAPPSSAPSLGTPVITAAEDHDVAADHLARRAYSRDPLSLASRL